MWVVVGEWVVGGDDYRERTTSSTLSIISNNLNMDKMCYDNLFS